FSSSRTRYEERSNGLIFDRKYWFSHVLDFSLRYTPHRKDGGRRGSALFCHLERGTRRDLIACYLTVNIGLAMC
ncbi:hypothetical protein, partial [Pedobacter sp.]